ncbi:MAG: uroporphyrinogen decarboxylase [Lysobacterales bacterium CG02_land_8_20_14_3_00_62_12]|nr:MAG: uroporphyrinogen decarboxylase [Xanthomonadales bacterium CG02_land_8_20_14_3_00_62_12]
MNAPLAALANDRFLRALKRQPVDRTPVWIMRQAGRYLPEYRATRARAGSFMKLCQTPELACEVSLQPVDRFPLDAAILFSDILTIPDAMGLGLSFAEGEGPRFARPLRSKQDIDRLGLPDMASDLGYVTDAVRMIRHELHGRVPLIGFSGSPWTLACYMIEGGGSEHFARAKSLLWDDPASAHRLLALLARTVAAYLGAQIAAGAQAVMVFDTWGGALSLPHYHEFSLRYLREVAALLPRGDGAARVPLILFSKGCGHSLEAQAETGADAIGLDWTIALDDARRRVGDRVALQGNVDPVVLYAGTSAIRAEAIRAVHDFGPHPGHVFNLGHGIHPTMDPEKLRLLIDTVHRESAALFASA